MGFIDAAVSLLLLVGNIFYSSDEHADNSLPDVKIHPILYPGSEVYKEWEQPSAPIYFKLYLFNVTNADDIVKNNAKPFLQQLGPYTYRMHKRKVNVTFHDNNTITYENLKWFAYEPAKSIGSLDDKVTTLNFHLVALATQNHGKLSSLEIQALNYLIRSFKSTLFITKTSNDLLFGGYVDELMVYLNKQSRRKKFPERFGFFYGLNHSTDGIYNIFNENSKFLQIAKWQHNDYLSFWNDKPCNLLQGTDGTAFTPPVDKDDVLWTFNPDLCRSIYLKYDGTEDINSLQTYRFKVPFLAVASADLNPENKCFCSDDKKCLLSGALSLGPCKNNAPVVITSPHFYQCDDRYYESVYGIQRYKSEHETFFDIEPTTGAVVRSAKRLQINFLLQPFDYINVMKNATQMIFPIFWIDESMDWTSDQVGEFKRKNKL